MFELDFLLPLESFQDKLNCRNCDLSLEANPDSFPIFSPIFQVLLDNQMADVQSSEQAKIFFTNPLPTEPPLTYKPGLSEIVTELGTGKDMPKEWPSVGRFLPGFLNMASHRFLQAGVEELSLQSAGQASKLQETNDSVLLKEPTLVPAVSLLNGSKLEFESKSKRDMVFENLSFIADKGHYDRFMSHTDPALEMIQDHEDSIAKLEPKAEGSGLLNINRNQSNISNGYTLSVPVSISLPHAPTVLNEIRATPPSQQDFDLDLKAANWERGLGERMIWMVDKHIQTASMKLNPPELGPVEVELAIKKDQININFITHGVQAKEALDFAIPKLREMFLSSGLNLADVNVNDQQARQFTGQFSDRENAHGFSHPSYQVESADGGMEQLESGTKSDRKSSQNILDIYT